MPRAPKFFGECLPAARKPQVQRCECGHVLVAASADAIWRGVLDHNAWTRAKPRLQAEGLYVDA